MKKIIAFLLLGIIFAPGFALADGGMIHFDPYSDRWDYFDETNQQAFINYENGVEKMILSVGVGDLKEGKTMWIFPVPADPNKVAVDVITKLPILRGKKFPKKLSQTWIMPRNGCKRLKYIRFPLLFFSGIPYQHPVCHKALVSQIR